MGLFPPVPTDGRHLVLFKIDGKLRIPLFNKLKYHEDVEARANEAERFKNVHIDFKIFSEEFSPALYVDMEKSNSNDDYNLLLKNGMRVRPLKNRDGFRTMLIYL